jgi:hypothetical protein
MASKLDEILILKFYLWTYENELLKMEFLNNSSVYWNDKINNNNLIKSNLYQSHKGGWWILCKTTALKQWVLTAKTLPAWQVFQDTSYALHTF